MIEYKVLKGSLLKSDDSKLTLDHFISTETQDDGGDIMRVDGMKTRGSVVVLKQHGMDPSHGNEPIAKPLDIRPGIHPVTGAKGLVATTQYYDGSHLTPPDNTGRRLFEKAKNGFMPNWSIGYQVIKSVPCQGGRDIKEWSLHEYSQVAVGMNAEANTPEMKALQAEAKTFGIVDNELFKAGFKAELSPEEKKVISAQAKISHKAMHIAHMACLKGLKEDALDSKCTKTCDTIAHDQLNEYASLVKDHVVKYIKAAQRNETGPEEDDDEDDDGKALAEAPAKIHRDALHTAHDALIKEIHGHKEKPDVDADDAAEKVLKDHKGLAHPHAVKYCEALQKSTPKEAVPLEIKTINEANFHADTASSALYTANYHLMNSLCNDAFDDTKDGEEADALADKNLDQHHGIAHEHASKFITAIRAIKKPASDEPNVNPEVKKSFLAKYLPQPGTKATEDKQTVLKVADPVAAINPTDKVLDLKTPGEEKVVFKITVPDPVEAPKADTFSVNCSAEELSKRIENSLSGQVDSVLKEARKERNRKLGKLPREE